MRRTSSSTAPTSRASAIPARPSCCSAIRRELKPLVDKRKGLAKVLEIVPAEDAVAGRRQAVLRAAPPPQVEHVAGLSRPRPQGRADTVVSAGNTGALLAISMFAMRMLEGADRPALASFLPTSAAARR